MTPVEQLEQDIEKARKRGVTEEQLVLFFECEPRTELLPYYARYVGKMGSAGALAQLHLEFGAPGNVAEELKLIPGDVDACPGNGQHEGIECQCDNCDHFLLCYPEWREGGAAWDFIDDVFDPADIIPPD